MIVNVRRSLEASTALRPAVVLGAVMISLLVHGLIVIAVAPDRPTAQPERQASVAATFGSGFADLTAGSAPSMQPVPDAVPTVAPEPIAATTPAPPPIDESRPATAVLEPTRAPSETVSDPVHTQESVDPAIQQPEAMPDTAADPTDEQAPTTITETDTTAVPDTRSITEISPTAPIQPIEQTESSTPPDSTVSTSESVVEETTPAGASTTMTAGSDVQQPDRDGTQTDVAGLGEPVVDQTAILQYMDQVFLHIEQVPRDRVSGEGRVRIRFVIDEAGTLISAGVQRPSGNSAIDAMALDIIERASPFPEPPPFADRQFDFEFIWR